MNKSKGFLLEAKNFQGFKKLKVFFDSGVNTIIGKSDKGKSSIIRMLKLLFENKPSGEKYRTHDTKLTNVSSTIDGHKIERIRSDSINKYKLDNGKPLSPEGVPDNIATILNIGKENIQSQHESYFLIDKPPGQVAKSLNKVSDLSVTDSLMQKVKKDLFNTNSAITTVKETVKDKKNKYKDLFWVDEAQKDLEQVIHMDKLLTDVRQEYFRIASVVDSLIKLEAEDKTPDGIDDAMIDLQSIISLKSDAEKNTIMLEGVLKKVIQAESKLERSVDFDSNDYTSIQKYITQINRLEVNRKVLKQALVQIQEQEEVVTKVMSDEVTLKKALDEVDNCPYCGSDV